MKSPFMTMSLDNPTKIYTTIWTFRYPPKDTVQIECAYVVDFDTYIKLRL